MLQPEVAQWLQRVVSRDYSDKKRVYGDVIDLLTRYPSLSPRTKVFSFEDGRSELLLCIHGTLPVRFRNAGYNTPITLWVDKVYPVSRPLAFVTPSPEMGIRAGNHVDPNGAIYHPLLAYWDAKKTIVELAELLREVFGAEMPVYARTAKQNGDKDFYGSTSPPPPPLPPAPHRANSPASPIHPSSPIPPPRPNYNAPPPKPPLPPRLLPGPSTAYSTSPAPPPPREYSPSFERPPTTQLQPRPSSTQLPPSWQAPARRPSPTRPTIDILDLQDALTATSAPPLPENPARRAQFEELNKRLCRRAETSTEKTTTMLESAKQVRERLVATETRLELETNELRRIEEACTRDTAILQERINAAEGVTRDALQSDEVDIDKILVGSRVVYNQIYDLVCADLAIDDTIYALGIAHERECITFDVFLRHVRILAREQFLKKALLAKIREQTKLQ